MSRRKRNDEDENLERWLLTYSDLITLLLAFFIVMYSMSRVDAKKFGEMSEALSGVLKGGTVVIKRGNEIGALPGHGVLDIGRLTSLGEAIERSFKELNKESEINVEVSERGLVIHVMESALFDEGKSNLKPKARQTLDIVAGHIRGVENHIRVEGHTDNKPINTRRFPSNWELSSARATEVLRYLSDDHRIEPKRLSALGFGEYRPIAANNSDENRARNRRVDIIVLTGEMTAAEPTSEFY